MHRAKQQPWETQHRLVKRMDELAAAGRLKKGTGTVPDHIILEEPPQLPDPHGVLEPGSSTSFFAIAEKTDDPRGGTPPEQPPGLH